MNLFEVLEAFNLNTKERRLFLASIIYAARDYLNPNELEEMRIMAHELNSHYDPRLDSTDKNKQVYRDWGRIYPHFRENYDQRYLHEPWNAPNMRPPVPYSPLEKLEQGAYNWSTDFGTHRKIRGDMEDLKNERDNKSKLAPYLYHAVEQAPADSPELHRGMRSRLRPDELLDKIQGHQYIDTPYSSFSSNPEIARASAEEKVIEDPNKGQTPFYLHLPEESKALHIQPITSPRLAQSEWISRGPYRVKNAWMEHNPVNKNAWNPYYRDTPAHRAVHAEVEQVPQEEYDEHVRNMPNHEPISTFFPKKKIAGPTSHDESASAHPFFDEFQIVDDHI